MCNSELGNIGEAIAKLVFIKAGYEIYTPETINASVDFIALKDNIPYRIQVKATTTKSIKLESWWTTVNKNVKKNFDSSKFDYVFAYHQPTDTYKIVKSETLTGYTSKSFSTMEECSI